MVHMVQTYSCKRKRKRWPVTFFFNIIDVSVIAAFVVWTAKNVHWNERKSHRRRLFVMELGYDLLQSHLDRRVHQAEALQNNVRLVL